MKWLRCSMISLLLIVPIAGCGWGEGAPMAGGGLPPRPKIPGELSPSEAKAKLREQEKNATRVRAGVPPRPGVPH